MSCRRDAAFLRSHGTQGSKCNIQKCPIDCKYKAALLQ